MRTSCLLVVVAALVLAPRPAAASDMMIVAPFPIADRSGRLARPTLEALEQYFTGRLASYPSISLIPGRDVKDRIQVQKRESFKDCYDQRCQIELGKDLAATHIVTPRLSAVGSQCIFSAFLYDLRTATTRSASTVRTKCDEDALVVALDRVVRELAGRAPGAVRLDARRRPPPAPEAPPPPLLAPVHDDSTTVVAEERSQLTGTLWLSGAALLAGSGVVVDVVPESSSNGELEAVDFVPIGLYAAGAAAAVIGILALLDD